MLVLWDLPSIAAGNSSAAMKRRLEIIWGRDELSQPVSLRPTSLPVKYVNEACLDHPALAQQPASPDQKNYNLTHRIMRNNTFFYYEPLNLGGGLSCSNR